MLMFKWAVRWPRKAERVDCDLSLGNREVDEKE